MFGVVDKNLPMFERRVMRRVVHGRFRNLEVENPRCARLGSQKFSVTITLQGFYEDFLRWPMIMRTFRC
jgi:hypothetical protein